jgi:hypothetical protein
MTIELAVFPLPHICKVILIYPDSRPFNVPRVPISEATESEMRVIYFLAINEIHIILIL